MKQDGDSLSHAVRMLHHYVDSLEFQLKLQGHGAEAKSYTEQLADAIEQGCFLHVDCDEAITLQNDVARLMKLATQLAGARAALIKNTPPTPAFLLQAAE